MARCEVIQVQCDRCKRVRLAPPQPPKSKPDFEAHLGDKVLKFDDLCESCKSAIMSRWPDLEQWEREVKQQFGPQLDNNQAPPMNPAPDYTPPKPHSQASTTKR